MEITTDKQRGGQKWNKTIFSVTSDRIKTAIFVMNFTLCVAYGSRVPPSLLDYSNFVKREVDQHLKAPTGILSTFL